MQLLAGSFCCSYRQRNKASHTLTQFPKHCEGDLLSAVPHFMQWLTYLLDVAAVKNVSSGIA